MRKQTESHIYLCAFASIAIITLMACSYCNGMTDEALREAHDFDQEIKNATDDRDYWHGKYISLSHETDAITVMAAEEKFEEGRR